MEKKITGHTDFTLKCNRSRWKKNQIGKTWNKIVLLVLTSYCFFFQMVSYNRFWLFHFSIMIQYENSLWFQRINKNLGT